MKKKMVLAMALTLMLCGCGKQAEDEGSVSLPDSKQSATTEASGETTDAAASGENGSDEKTASGNAASEGGSFESEEAPLDFAWFGKGVYEVTENDNAVVYYIFYDTKSGKTTSLETGMGLGFECEQSKDEVIFHMGGVEANSAMTMSTDADGNIVGNMNGIKYTFKLLPYADPNDFDPETRMTSDESDPFVGDYRESHAGRGVVTITKDVNTENGYNVHIDWAGSAFESATWDFTGEFSGRQVLEYSDCTKKHLTYSEDGSCEFETEYTDGTGYIKVTDEGLFWSDNKENTGDDFVFIKD